MISILAAEPSKSIDWEAIGYFDFKRTGHYGKPIYESAEKRNIYFTKDGLWHVSFFEIF